MFKFVYHQVYNQKTLFPKFAELLQNTTHSARILSPYVFLRRLERHEKQFRAAIARGVCICVTLQQPNLEAMTEEEIFELDRFNKLVERLRTIGVHVSFRSDFHEKMATFDEIRMLDGSANYLSQSYTNVLFAICQNSVQELRFIG